MTRLSFGSGPDFQSSNRVKMVCCPGVQLSTLKAPPPASLCETHSKAHGSLSVACFFASSELTIVGMGTTRSGLERGLECVIVDHRELFRFYHRSSAHLDRGKSAGGDRPVE